MATDDGVNAYAGCVSSGSGTVWGTDLPSGTVRRSRWCRIRPADGRHVALIVAQGGDPPVLAAKSATATIPVVFTLSSDPIKLGVVGSLNRPGGNVTGFWPYTSLLGTKRLELMRQLLPANASIAVLVNPD